MWIIKKRKPWRDNKGGGIAFGRPIPVEERDLSIATAVATLAAKE